MFQLNRVQYDIKEQKLVKDNSKFDFDKEIYLDLFLNVNKAQSDKHHDELEKMKAILKSVKEDRDNLTVKNDIVRKFKDCEDFI